MTCSPSLLSCVDKAGTIPGHLPPFQKVGEGDSKLDQDRAVQADMASTGSAIRPNSVPQACRGVWLRNLHKNIRCRQPKPTDQTPLPELVEGSFNKAGNLPGLLPPFQKGGWGDSTPLPELVEGRGFDTCPKNVQRRQAQPSNSKSKSTVVFEKAGNLPGFLPPFLKGGWGDSRLAPRVNSADLNVTFKDRLP